MPYLRPPSVNEIRVLLLTGAVSAVVGGSILWDLRDQETFLPGLAPFAFMVGSVAMLLLAMRMWSRTLFSIASVATVTGLATRAISMLLAEARDIVEVDPDRIRLAFLVYVSFGALLAFWWVRVVLPIVWFERNVRHRR